MSAPSSSPRPERAPRPGVTWQTELVRREDYVPECIASIRGTCLAEAQGDTACAVEDGECVHAAPMPSFNRETRRALKRAARRTK